MDGKYCSWHVASFRPIREPLRLDAADFLGIAGMCNRLSQDGWQRIRETLVGGAPLKDIVGRTPVLMQVAIGIAAMLQAEE
eukprot:393319-Pyramimonas_sp.AAC.1